MARLDLDGDGIVSRIDFLAAVVPSFGSERGADAGDGAGSESVSQNSGSPTGTGFSDPLTDGN